MRGHNAKRLAETFQVRLWTVYYIVEKARKNQTSDLQTVHNYLPPKLKQNNFDNSMASRASGLPPPTAAGTRTPFLGACPEPHICIFGIETAENVIGKRKRQEVSALEFNV